MSECYDLTQLRAEGELLHLSFFGSPIPEPVLEKYIEAHNFYLTAVEAKELEWMATAVRLRFDLEALEIVQRLSNKEHILVRKAKILIHITEAFDAYRSKFINESPQKLKALTSLSYHLFRTGMKYLKGRILLGRLNQLV